MVGRWAGFRQARKGDFVPETSLSLPPGLPCSTLFPDYLRSFPQTSTRFPSHSPSHSRVVHVRRSRFFHSWEWANVSSSGLKSEKTVREATSTSFFFAR